MLLAHSLPRHFRHQVLASIPCRWQPWHPELQRVRGRTGRGEDRAVSGRSREGPGEAGKEPSAHHLTEQLNARFASSRSGRRSPQPVLGWRASATVCPAAAMAPSPSSGPLSLPVPSCPGSGDSSPGDSRGGSRAGLPGTERVRGRRGRWAVMLTVEECRRRSL